MSVLVTGGAGYIGSHTAVALLEKGYEIVIIDDFSNSSPEVLNRIREITGKDFAFYEFDLRDSGKLEDVFRAHKIDSAIHFAGYKAVGQSVAQPLKYYDNNLNCTITLLSEMAKAEVRTLIFSSSATVYGGESKMPVAEDASLGCINPYGFTKLFCEQIITDTAEVTPGFSGVLLRYFNPVGAHISGKIGEDPSDVPNNLVPYITQTAIGKLSHLNVFGDDYPTPDGSGVRDYIHITDLAVGHIAALEYAKNNPGTAAFNLGTGIGYSVLEMVSMFEKVSGKKIDYKITARRAGDLAECFADVKKAGEVLGWTAKLGLHEMLADSWRWQSMNPNGYKK